MTIMIVIKTTNIIMIITTTMTIMLFRRTAWPRLVSSTTNWLPSVRSCSLSLLRPPLRGDILWIGIVGQNILPFLVQNFFLGSGSKRDVRAAGVALLNWFFSKESVRTKPVN